MAMVLSSRYASPRDFYISRFMRIFPPYWIVLAGTVVLSVASGLFFRQWLLLDPYVSHPFVRNGAIGVFLAASFNLTLIGQDWIMFLSNDVHHSLHLTTNFWNDLSPLYQYLLVPQCWSIGVELSFYACAPYLNRMHSHWLIIIATGALGARLYSYQYLGLAHDPWNYRFFPFEISLFIFGMLGYRLYMHAARHRPSERFRCSSRTSYFFCAVILLFVLYISAKATGFVSHYVGHEVGPLITYPFLIIGIPLLFFAFGNQKDDRLVGELSYPIYLVHFTVISINSILLSYWKLPSMVGIASAFVSIALAAIFYFAFIMPLDKRRHYATVVH